MQSVNKIEEVTSKYIHMLFKYCVSRASPRQQHDTRLYKIYTIFKEKPFSNQHRKPFYMNLKINNKKNKMERIKNL